MTGYMMFAKTIKQRVKNNKQDLTTKELMRLISKEWSMLSPDEKFGFDQKAGDDRAHQNQEFTEFRRKMDIDGNEFDDSQQFHGI